jgi:hypothetical protein
MRRKRPYYEAQAWPDGRFEVWLMDEFAERATTFASRTVKPEDTPIGYSLLQAAEAAAKAVIHEDKERRAEQKRLTAGSDGTVLASIDPTIPSALLDSFHGVR